MEKNYRFSADFLLVPDLLCNQWLLQKKVQPNHALMFYRCGMCLYRFSAIQKALFVLEIGENQPKPI